MKSTSHMFSHLSGACIITAIVFGPLAFGSVEPWAYSILAFTSFTALASCLVHDIGRERLSIPLSFPLLIGFLSLVLVILQIIPWPASLLETLQPETYSIYERLREFSGGVSDSVLSPSIYPYATRVSLLKLASYLALFTAALGYINSRRRLNMIATALIVTAFTASMFGILQNLAGVREVFWLRRVSGGSPFGQFASRNLFAAYGSICFFVGLGMLLSRGNYASALPFRRSSAHKKLPSANPWQNMLLGFAVSITGVAVVWSLSRGGIVSAVLAGAFVIFALLFCGYTKDKKLYVFAVLLVVAGFVTYLGWGPVISRLETLGVIAEDPSAVDRTRYGMWADAWRMGRLFPVLGTGAGTFLSVYPAFRSPAFNFLARNPHSEYLCVLAETGFSGLLLFLSLLPVIVVKIGSGLKKVNNMYTRGFLAGALGAVLTVSFHSVVDFPFRSPGIVATMAVIIAIIFRLAVVGKTKRDVKINKYNEEAKRKNRSHLSLPVKSISLITVFFVWIFVSSLCLNELNGNFEELRITRASERLTSETVGVPEFVRVSEQTITRYSPRNADLYARLAQFSRRAAETVSNPRDRLVLAEKSLELWEKSVELDPLNARYRLNVVVDYLAFGRADFAWMHARTAANVHERNIWLRIDLAETFLMNGLHAPAEQFLEEAETIAREYGVDRALRSIERLRSE